MLAGFNGLEAGQGILLTLTLTIIAFFSGQITAMILGLAMIGALLGFLWFNWFPAKIFGGDALTLMVGANLAVMSILGNMQTFGALLFGLFFVEFLSITHLILKIKPMKEWQLTLTIMGIQTIICLIVLMIYLL